MVKNDSLQSTLIHVMKKHGYDEDFAYAIAGMLKTDKSCKRMISYLRQAGNVSEEDIADEALAILSDRHAWIQKKKAEYYNSRYNDLLLHGLDDKEN